MSAPIRRRAVRVRTVLLAGAVATAAVLGGAQAGVFAGLERQSLDARFAVRGTQPSSGVAVVAIDEKSFSEMNVTWPMRRTVHADMIDRLRRAGARLIAYDVQFTEPSGRDADDLALFDAVARAPGTVLATAESDADGHTRVLGGDEQLKEIGARAASSTFPSDTGGVIRRYARENTQLDTLAVAVADQLGRTPGHDRFERDGTALIDFRGPASAIPTYSFVDVARGRVPASALRGKIVVVGASAPVLQDIHPTSASGPRLMPGPTIQANAIWTALHGNPLQTAPGWVGTVAALILGLLGAALVARFGVLRAPVAALVLAALALAAAVGAFMHGVVVPVVVPLAALAASVVATAFLVVAAEAALRAHLTRYSEQLEREVQARTAQLAEAQLEVVMRLARTAELRDDDTGEHVDRMSALCGEVARELGMSDTEATMLRHASALHDIGKIGVPDAILLKPGRLTDEEFAVMRQHVAQGAALLRDSQAPVLQLAEEVARTHHERWDGGGYPAGLAGEAIPLSGRIAAVCDVFDALTNARPYKRAWTIQEATDEIARCRGSHFDPQVADALLALIARRAAQAPSIVGMSPVAAEAPAVPSARAA
ncbi:MAG: CHASE2 domain-containing protein [Patulibacter sp.]